MRIVSEGALQARLEERTDAMLDDLKHSAYEDYFYGCWDNSDWKTDLARFKEGRDEDFVSQLETAFADEKEQYSFLMDHSDLRSTTGLQGLDDCLNSIFGITAECHTDDLIERDEESEKPCLMLDERSDTLIGVVVDVAGCIKALEPMVAERWAIHELDVWGNDADGFEVNAVYPSRKNVDFPVACDADEVVKILKDAALKAQVKNSKLNIDWHECTAYVTYCGKPLLELRKIGLVKA